ncbi:MAG: ABC transporter permease [Chloroflexota bacterium]
MKAFVTHFGFEFKTGLRNSNLLMMNYLFPIGVYIVLGLLMAKINASFLGTMVPAMGIFAIMASTILGMPGPLVDAREAGIYRSYKINGVPAFSILIIPALTTIFHGLIATALISLSAPLLFGGLAPDSWLNLALVMIVTAFACAGIGALISVISKDTRGTVLWSQLIFLPAMIIGGLMIPISALPSSLARVSMLLPTAHAMQASLGLAYHQETTVPPLGSLLALLANGLLAFGLATYLFNWDTRNASRRGHPLMALIAWVPFTVTILLRGH